MALAVYDSKTVNFPLVNSLTTPLTQAFGSNPNRVSLLISCSASAAGGSILVSAVQNNLQEYLNISPPISLLMPYRDYGPLMRQAVFIGSTAALVGQNVSVTEVWRVPTK